MRSIAECRQEIDSIDEQIIALLERRFSVSYELGAVKRAEGLAVLDTTRQQSIRDKIYRITEKHAAEIDSVYQTIFSVSQNVQR